MENYVVMIAVGIAFFALSFLSGCWYTRWKSGAKKERDYDAVVRQFRRFERDDEYRQIRQRLTEELSSYNQNEQKPIATRKLYAMRIEQGKGNKTILISLCFFLPLLLLYILLSIMLGSSNDMFYIMSGGAIVFSVYLICIIISVKRWLRCLKTIYIMEDVIKDLGNGISPRKQDSLNLNDMNELVNALKPAKKEHSITSLI